MNQQHFKELLGTILKSTHSSKVQVAEHLNVSPARLWNWENKHGLPRRFAPSVLSSLRVYCFTKLGG